MVYTVDETGAGKRLDVFASEVLPTISRAFVQRLIDNGRITVNSEDAKAGQKLHKGNTVSVDFELQELDQIPDIDLPVLYEDDNVLVVNKPVGVISHSRGRYWDEPSVASFVRQKTGQEGERAGIVHRLDRATSGVMICAKNQETLSFLQKQFGNRNVKKTYYALVTGELDPSAAVIDMPIGRNPQKPQMFRVHPSGKPSVTNYETIDANGTYSLIKLTPETGRTHQLRVHLDKMGHPIVGDTFYDGEKADRLYLHANMLEITLPGGERKTFEAPLPVAFKDRLK
jgi:23S rRNA pseudouridine1911/1915/1917 synthase